MADKAVETALRSAIGAAFPADAILGEEHADTAGLVVDIPGSSIPLMARGPLSAGGQCLDADRAGQGRCACGRVYRYADAG